ncbi:MAG TPA: magnesium-translocating P-type ATPase [Pirellulales bacterium]|nr:magnesium-translocating P-type ATPase [Pirellulales bacterium]
MRILPAAALPKRLLHGALHPAANVPRSQRLLEASSTDAAGALELLHTRRDGLSEAEAQHRLEKYGPNSVSPSEHRAWPRLLAGACLNPLVVLLAVLGILSAISGDLRAAAVMWSMVVLGVVLRFVQETRADTAAAKLKSMISVTATVVRAGTAREVPLVELVPGDVVTLAAGDMIPADLRLLSCKELFISQATLTGETFPTEKFANHVGAPPGDGLDLPNICFMGTSVQSGAATGVVVETGWRTYLGGISRSVTSPQAPTSFERGTNRFTWFMIRLLLVMTPLVFLINGLTKGDWREAFFFALAVAVGLTPEMLPMIVTVCLGKGALAMSRQKVIVKRLNAIQNCGAMDVLCTDKTGTLTIDRVILQRHCDVAGKEDAEVFSLAFLNSHFQTGLKNVLDRAVLRHHELHAEIEIPDCKKVDEIPFDFSRKCMSVVVDMPSGERLLICKGAPEVIFERCDCFELDGRTSQLSATLLDELREEYSRLSRDGFRVLAIAQRTVENKPAYSKEDERELVLRGYVAFLDPPKDTAAAALTRLASHGVTVKVLTGDNELVSRKICREVGLGVDQVLLGREVENMSDAQLSEAASNASLFAQLSPGHKERIIKALRACGHVVGYLGDGVNDVPALHAADVGISVDNAVDIARESADLILLEKSLLVLVAGVLEGRKVYANILKYIRMGASSNFGNMLSVLGASFFLPYLPMAPIQILTNNLLYDFSQLPIPTDDVDPEQIATPRPWSKNEIVHFILFIGPCSSLFDYTTWFVMLYFFDCWSPERAALFQTAWFVESLVTQTLIIHIIRTNRIPFAESRASWPLLVATGAAMAVGISLPFSPLAPSLGLTSLPAAFWPLLVLTLLSYAVLAHAVKRWLLRRRWI